jgi:prevent-host-death family protein
MIVMKKSNTANVAAFKAHLGEYLRIVKTGGEVIVMDRQTPVARLIPYQENEPFKLEILKAAEPFHGITEFYQGPIKGLKVDSLKALLEEREDRR